MRKLKNYMRVISKSTESIYHDQKLIGMFECIYFLSFEPLRQVSEMQFLLLTYVNFCFCIIIIIIIINLS
jgi:hypothetical protein